MKVAVVIKGSVVDRHGKRILVNRVSEFTDAVFKHELKLGKLRELPREAAEEFRADQRKANDGDTVDGGGKSASL